MLIQVNDLDQGELENAVLSLARGLATRGFEPVVLVLGRQGTAAAQAQKPAWRNTRTAQAQAQAALPNAPGAAWLRSGECAVLGLRHLDRDRLGVPFVQVVHNTYVWLGPREVDSYRSADRFTSAYVCVSGLVARYCDRNLGLSVEKMVLIPNGIDLQALEAARGESPGRLRRELGLLGRTSCS